MKTDSNSTRAPLHHYWEEAATNNSHFPDKCLVDRPFAREKASRIQTLSESGDLEALHELGWRSLLGEGVSKDWPKAIALITKAAQKGGLNAQNSLGLLYDFGLGVPQKTASAIRWYEKAAKAGHPLAAMHLAQAYLNSRKDDKAQGKALESLRKAAEQGIPEAMSQLGYYYEAGIGTEEDNQQARRWYQRAAEMNYLPAFVELGESYAYDEEDYKQGIHWFLQGAERGSITALSFLANIFLSGENKSVPMDRVVALAQEAAGRGEPEGFLILDACYRRGIHLEKDPIQAYAHCMVWFNFNHSRTGAPYADFRMLPEWPFIDTEEDEWHEDLRFIGRMTKEQVAAGRAAGEALLSADNRYGTVWPPRDRLWSSQEGDNHTSGRAVPDAIAAAEAELCPPKKVRPLITDIPEGYASTAYTSDQKWLIAPPSCEIKRHKDLLSLSHEVEFQDYRSLLSLPEARFFSVGNYEPVMNQEEYKVPLGGGCLLGMTLFLGWVSKMMLPIILLMMLIDWNYFETWDRVLFITMPLFFIGLSVLCRMKFPPTSFYCFNRRTGMITFPAQGKEPPVSLPFAEFDGRQLMCNNGRGRLQYVYGVYHRFTDRFISMGTSVWTSWNELEWAFLQQYMDCRLPLPDTPGLEPFRQLDPTTREFDKRKNRPERKWRDLPKDRIRPEQKEGHQALKDYSWIRRTDCIQVHDEADCPHSIPQAG